jgi:hypothetical protein
MGWLCEATPEEIVSVGRKTKTMEELETAVRKYVQRRIKRRNPYNQVCTKINYSFPPKTIVFLRKTIVFCEKL